MICKMVYCKICIQYVKYVWTVVNRPNIEDQWHGFLKLSKRKKVCKDIYSTYFLSIFCNEWCQRNCSGIKVHILFSKFSKVKVNINSKIHKYLSISVLFYTTDCHFYARLQWVQSFSMHMCFYACVWACMCMHKGVCMHVWVCVHACVHVFVCLADVSVREQVCLFLIVGCPSVECSRFYHLRFVPSTILPAVSVSIHG